MDVSKIIERELELLHCLRDQLLRLRQVIGIVELFVADPLEAVELVVVLLDLVEGEAAPAILRASRLRIACSGRSGRRRSTARTRRSVQA